MRSLPVALLLLVFLVFQASARTWHIKPDGTGDAPTIQAGVDSAAAGDSVLLAAGTYHDCTHVGPSNVKHCVIMKTGVVLRSETGQAAGVTIDARGQGRGILCNAVSGGAAIEYLTITGGSASTGGGMYCNGGAVALTGLLFSGNTSSEIGGGLYILGAQTWPAIMECVFAGNTSPDGGGAMVYGSDQKVTFTRCVFSYNYGGMGGGLECVGDWRGNASVTLDQCTLTGNRTGGFSGGGVEFDECSGTCRLCVFVGNYGGSGWTGGTIFAYGPEDLGCPTLLLLVEACTIYGNNGGNAVAIWANVRLMMRNTIIAATVGGYGAFLSHPGEMGIYPSWVVSCSDVYGNTPHNWELFQGSGSLPTNFSACPSFCNADLGDFHLCDQSPCLPGNHPKGANCSIIGALGQGCSCGPSRVEGTTWGAIKAIYGHKEAGVPMLSPRGQSKAQVKD